jgi:ribA/ribD-fused uncharacterized protein
VREIRDFHGENFFLDNFFVRDFIIDGVVYKTVEHRFQSKKMMNKEDEFEIIVADSPSKAKMLGNMLYMRKDWYRVRYSVMLEAVWEKFSQHEDLKNKLLETGEALLVEGNTWHDNIWGDCECIKCRNIEGQNYLGKILMKVREELRI